MITHVVVGPGKHYMSLLAAFDALHALASDYKENLSADTPKTRVWREAMNGDLFDRESLRLMYKK